MFTIIQSTPAWQLRASITPICGDQHYLMVTSVVPTARRAQEHVRWQAQLSVDELRSLRDIIDKALACNAGPVASQHGPADAHATRDLSDVPSVAELRERLAASHHAGTDDTGPVRQAIATA